MKRKICILQIKEYKWKDYFIILFENLFSLQPEPGLFSISYTGYFLSFYT